jgi:hypothetical protein
MLMVVNYRQHPSCSLGSHVNNAHPLHTYSKHWVKEPCKCQIPHVAAAASADYPGSACWAIDAVVVAASSQ